MKITLRIHIRCISCFQDRMVNIDFYSFSKKVHQFPRGGKIKLPNFKCDNCGYDEFFAMPYFPLEIEKNKEAK